MNWGFPRACFCHSYLERDRFVQVLVQFLVRWCDDSMRRINWRLCPGREILFVAAVYPRTGVFYGSSSQAETRLPLAGCLASSGNGDPSTHSSSPTFWGEDLGGRASPLSSAPLVPRIDFLLEVKERDSEKQYLYSCLFSFVHNWTGSGSQQITPVTSHFFQSMSEAGGGLGCLIQGKAQA